MLCGFWVLFLSFLCLLLLLGFLFSFICLSFVILPRRPLLEDHASMHEVVDIDSTHQRDTSSSFPVSYIFRVLIVLYQLS